MRKDEGFKCVESTVQRKSGEEACASRLEQVEKSVGCDKSISMNERKSVLDSGETYNVVWFRDCGTEEEFEIAKVRLFKFYLGVKRVERIRNEHIRRTAHFRCSGEKVRKARLKCFGHVQKWGGKYIDRKLRLE